MAETKTHFAVAYEKGIISQPRKTSIVAALVRDRYVADAVVILNNTPRRAAPSRASTSKCNMIHHKGKRQKARIIPAPRA